MTSDIEINWEEFSSLIESELGYKLTQHQIEQFTQYYDFLNEFNSHTNLTRIPKSDIPLLHFFDSLAVIKFFDFNNSKSLIDIGTGPGFPGVPLKILFPHLKVSLVDSKIKKVNFLNQLSEKLGLKDCSSFHARSEDLSKMPQFKNKYDVGTARAVTQTEDLVSLLKPFLSKEGVMVLYKGPKMSEELEKADKVLKKENLKVQKLEEFHLPNAKGERSFIFINSSQA